MKLFMTTLVMLVLSLGTNAVAACCGSGSACCGSGAACCKKAK